MLEVTFWHLAIYFWDTQILLRALRLKYAQNYDSYHEVEMGKERNEVRKAGNDASR